MSPVPLPAAFWLFARLRGGIQKNLRNKMPIPSPKGPEAKKEFVNRCMSDSVMVEEFSDEKQRAAVCYSKWRRAEGSEYIPEDEDSEVIIY